jgi:hypothetical protein
MEGYCSTDQSSQRAVVPVEEEEEELTSSVLQRMRPPKLQQIFSKYIHFLSSPVRNFRLV